MRATDAPIRAIIVDDEPLARRGIRLRLAEEPGFEVVGEYPSGESACREFGEVDPDVVFLDIRMPEMDGFEMLERIDESRVAVVFLTAYEDHALRAFAFRALDYVLKPPSDERLDRTLLRVRQHVEERRSARLGRQVRDMVTGSAAPAPPPGQPPAKPDVLRVRHQGRIMFVRPTQIDWIEAAGNYVRLHAGSGSHLAKYSIRDLERRLDSHGFVRIHRGTLVNADRIVELQPHFHGDYVAVLRDRTVLKVGRTYREALLGH